GAMGTADAVGLAPVSVPPGFWGRAGTRTGGRGGRLTAGTADGVWPPAIGDWLSSTRIAARACSHASSNPIHSHSHRGSVSAAACDLAAEPSSSALGSSPEPFGLPLPLGWPTG